MPCVRVEEICSEVWCGIVRSLDKNVEKETDFNNCFALVPSLKIF